MENRLHMIFDAASALFINKGYVRTQMKDIAKQIGLSTGMLYVYFKGKKELLDFILKGTIDREFIGRDFSYPITEELFWGLEDEVIAVLEESCRGFGAPLERQARGYPFCQMVSDAFDTIARYGTGCLILEKNIGDMGKLGAYYQEYRKKFFGQMLAYIRLYETLGEIRAIKYPELTTQLMIETLAWWGMHAMHDAFEVQKDIPLDAAKEVCLDNLLSAYRRNG
ncbi:TetR/AcrR family transcriptional regulator [Intestinibacillus massiliensis]|uniref:TetR/AcrR family transcriptional regulator n=1 Tax=Intestinibacillus massiliensis TaxID=1871029 RepID=UPI000B352991|nr:helix-turn-helix domain-containing protein [Intestinibacillus massiliensis]